MTVRIEPEKIMHAQPALLLFQISKIELQTHGYCFLKKIQHERKHRQGCPFVLVWEISVVFLPTFSFAKAEHVVKRKYMSES